MMTVNNRATERRVVQPYAVAPRAGQPGLNNGIMEQLFDGLKIINEKELHDIVLYHRQQID